MSDTLLPSASNPLIIPTFPAISSRDDTGPDGGTIVGIVAGVLFGILLITGLIVCNMKRRPPKVRWRLVLAPEQTVEAPHEHQGTVRPAPNRQGIWTRRPDTPQDQTIELHLVEQGTGRPGPNSQGVWTRREEAALNRTIQLSLVAPQLARADGTVAQDEVPPPSYQIVTSGGQHASIRIA